MKLRIRGNSVRLRLSQSELTRLAEAGFAEDRTEFGVDSALVYRIDVVPAGEVRAAFDGGSVGVAVPRGVLERWLDPREVSIRAEQPLAGGATLRILVEKDFACLAPRAGEDDSDLFPNPGVTEA